MRVTRGEVAAFLTGFLEVQYWSAYPLSVAMIMTRSLVIPA